MARRLSAPPNVTFDVTSTTNPIKPITCVAFGFNALFPFIKVPLIYNWQPIWAPSTSMNIFLPAYALSKVKCFLYQQAPPNIGPPPLSPLTKVSSSFGVYGTPMSFHVASLTAALWAFTGSDFINFQGVSPKLIFTLLLGSGV